MATWLEIADECIAAAERARLAGDTVASLHIALYGAQCLQIARLLEKPAASPPLPRHPRDEKR